MHERFTKMSEESFQQALKLMPNDVSALKLLQQTQLEKNSAGKTQAAFQQARDAGDGTYWQC